MYIHMTTKCNFSCEHCLFDYGAGKRGTNMDIQTFSMALQMVRSYDMHLTLGGGELTLHKSYKKFVTMAIEATRDNDIGLLIVTNGSNKIPAIWLIETMYNEKELGNDKFNVELSIDEFHDTYKIDPYVLGQFKCLNKIRTVTKNGNSLINAGRATNLGHSYNLRNDCPCSDLQILVDGTIKWCGCKDAPIIGNINFDQDLPENWNSDCHKYKEELIEA